MRSLSLPESLTGSRTLLVCLAVLGTAGCVSGGAVPVGTAKPANAVATTKTCIAGHYHGAATEIAAALELDAGGRFEYVLIYGALDERAEGRWTISDEAIFLTSDPVVPPAFAYLGDTPSPDGRLHVELDVPDAISPQYFDAEIEFADGTNAVHQLAEEGLALDLSERRRIERVRLLLPLFGLKSEYHTLDSGQARSLRFRFTANDIGKVAFANERLNLSDNAVLLQRHGRELRLLRQEPPCPSP